VSVTAVLGMEDWAVVTTSVLEGGHETVVTPGLGTTMGVTLATVPIGPSNPGISIPPMLGIPW